MIFQDSRYSTHNTNLAACMGALRIPIKNTDPVSMVEDAETGKRVVTWFFENANGGNTHKGRQLEKWWGAPRDNTPAEKERAASERAKFEKEQPGHPMIPMRRALEKLEWLQNVWFGKVHPAARNDSREYSTESMDFAACLMASGYDLLCFEKPRFYFAPAAVQFRPAFDGFQNPSLASNPVSLMRRALECRRLLIKLLKHPDLKRLIHYTHGDPMAGGREAYIVEGTPEDTVELLLSKLYA